MTTNNPYCVLTDVKGLLGLKSSSDDAWITSLISQAQAVIDGELGYAFQQDGTLASPTTRVYSGKGNPFLYIGFVQSVTQAVEVMYSLGMSFDGYTVSSPNTQDITADVVIGPENRNPGWTLERLSGRPFSPGTRNYKITGIFGRSDIPADITRACARLTAFYYKMRDTNYADVLVEQGGARTRYTKTIPDDVNDILDNYRVHLFYGG